MTIGYAAVLSLGFAGAVALGILIGPLVTTCVVTRETRAAAAPTVATPPAAPVTPATRATAPAAPRRATIPASSIELHKRLKAVLSRGANPTSAATGFRDGEQFAAVAHAARNTGVPFQVLKHRVLEEHKSLEAAIRELKPDIDASAEANRARKMARADIAALASS
jgi:hypothetical protein